MILPSGSKKQANEEKRNEEMRKKERFVNRCERICRNHQRDRCLRRQWAVPPIKDGKVSDGAYETALSAREDARRDDARHRSHQN